MDCDFPPVSSLSPIVLTVDDNEDNLWLSVHLIEQLNCQALVAQDGFTALAMARHYNPSLLLLDITMPNFSGIDVLLTLKQDPQTCHIPVVAVTAMAKTEERDRILEAGCDHYVSKPYAIEELEALIRQYVDRDSFASPPAE